MNPWDAIVDTPPYTYAPTDMVVLIPCATHRHPMVYMTRNLWRKGIKAYIASNGTQVSVNVTISMLLSYQRHSRDYGFTMDINSKMSC